MTDSELKKATIFDLTSDEKVLRELLGIMDGQKTPTREEYLAGAAPESPMFDMLEYAEDMTHNKSLTKQLKTVFKEELASFFNE